MIESMAKFSALIFNKTGTIIWANRYLCVPAEPVIYPETFPAIHFCEIIIDFANRRNFIQAEFSEDLTTCSHVFDASQYIPKNAPQNLNNYGQLF